ncbi:uncharacterized protein [Parasteatoda tepidariorum]|uniref:uncharacterized protein n=1 Tax=Parasteatoda tepidariorum TaxID=114398 RepID=UPI0039BD1E52
MILADCSTHSLITSDIQNCHTREGVRKCDMFTTAEITLKGFDYEACLWFQDSRKSNLLQLKLRLVSSQCSFSTKRKHFTFPVQERTISQLACPQNYQCAWGEHCVAGKEFEGLPDESLTYPGFNACHPSSVGSGCIILSRMGCLFYRLFFVPDLLNSYKVRKIIGHHCTYTIAVERARNMSTELLTLQPTAVTSDGIFLEILGSYNQPPLHLSDSLVLRVGDPSDAYLIQSSPQNHPTADMVGQVQANTRYTKDFIFDKDIVTCNFFESTLRCEKRPDGLQTMISTKENSLPLTRDMHLLAVEKGVLKSNLLSSAPVRVQLHFKNYKISLEHNEICPKITSKDIKSKGCYSCQILSKMYITALSNCQAGTVPVEFQVLQLHTQSLYLETEPREFNIQF